MSAQTNLTSLPTSWTSGQNYINAPLSAYLIVGNGPSGLSQSYSYDPVGNRTSLTNNGTQTSYTYDKADRILTAGSTNYTDDANGNVIARGSDSFGYDQANRLTSATVSGTTTTNAYDGDGKRASQTTGGTTTNYSYDVNGSLPNVLTDGTLKYVYGLGLAYAVDGSGNVQVYHDDGLGSVRAITNSGGSIIQTYQTDPFGAPTQTQGSSSQPFEFTCQQHDGTRLYDLRARMYDPATGRFMERDPWPGRAWAPGTLNRYSYVGDNPSVLSDPSGLISIGLCLNGAIGVAVYGSASGCVAAATNGDLGVQASLGIGGTSGFLGGLGVGPQVSTASDLSDLNGPFGTAGASARLGPGVGGDVFWGPNGQGRMTWGGSVQLGVGADYTPPIAPGVEIHGGVTDTLINVYFNVPKAIRSLLHWLRPPESPDENPALNVQPSTIQPPVNRK